MHTTGIVLAAGRGLRCRTKIPKLLIKIDSQAIIFYSLDTLSNHPYIKDIIVVVNAKNKSQILNKIKQYRIKKIKAVVLGGRRRQDSVLHALKAINKKTDLILIHDGARPFINQEMVSRVIKAAKRYQAAVVAVPVKATIKEVVSCQLSVVSKYMIKKTLDRNNLWEVQTPQVFKKELILEAYKKFGDIGVTDDASLVEKLGVKVRIVKGSYFNIKITTPEDLVIAEAISKSIR